MKPLYIKLKEEQKRKDQETVEYRNKMLAEFKEKKKMDLSNLKQHAEQYDETKSNY